MSTLEEFENAPVGATATRRDGRRATKTDRDTWPWDTNGGCRSTSRYMVSAGYTLDQPTPTTAREALELAWSLAHPVKMGQAVPAGTACLSKEDDGYRESMMPVKLIATHDWADVRTLEPLPEPTQGWLDAPAVLATHEDSHDYLNKSVWHPTRFNNRVWSSGLLTAHWYELTDVTPLYPKEGKES